MSDTELSNIENSNSKLYEILKNCVKIQSEENLSFEDYNDVCAPTDYCDYFKMISLNSCSTSGTFSSSSFASDDSYSDQSILEEDGRISLAYENLRTIPTRIAEKFAIQTKFLDLSHNNFQNIAFLTFFEELHTLIMDHNTRLDVNTMPLLANLRILWINNCEITNIMDWLQRIQFKCPNLTQLSIMGNPGIDNLSNQSYMLPSPSYHSTMMELTMPLQRSVVSDYRELIRQVLPQLEYLDGIALYKEHSINNYNSHLLSSGSSNGNNSSPNVNSASDHKLHRGNSSSGSSGSSAGHDGNAGNKSSPTLSFKDLFRIKRRKKSYQSSSTN